MKTIHPDPGALRKLLNSVKRRQEHIRESCSEEEALRQEIGDFLAATKPGDVERVSIIGSKKIQLDLHPSYRRKLEEEIENLVTSLEAEADRFRSELVRFLGEQLQSQVDATAAALRSFFPGQIREVNGERLDRAILLAHESAACLAIKELINQAGAATSSTQPRSNDASAWDARLISAVNQLIVLAEQK